MKRAASGIRPMVAVDRTLATPLHRQIYNGFRSAILEGRLRPGQRIPSTRVLAAEIRVSRFPVLNAYAQLLAESYLESRVGAGTVVSSSLPEQLTSSRPTGTKTTPIKHGPRAVAARTTLPPEETFPWIVPWGPFRVGQVAFDQFPHQVWSRLIARRSRSMNSHSAHYGAVMGSEILRGAIANYLKTARSVRCTPEQVLIVNGSQQALEITARVLLDPGARVWIEDPCYRFAQDVFKLNGCELVPVSVDEEGLDVAAGITKCRNARAAFVSPSHQFPLGVTMSASRRLDLLDWAEGRRSWILEDDYDSEYRYEGMPITSLQGLDRNSRVVYIGTFSKVLFPSLRLGYVVLPADLVERFLAVRFAIDISPPTFYQKVVADFIREGHFSRHIRRMRSIYGQRRSALLRCIRQELGTTAEVAGGETGLHLSVILNGISDREVAARAARQNLSLMPLSPFYARKAAPQGFVLGFGSTSVQQMPAAVHKLCMLLKSRS